MEQLIPLVQVPLFWPVDGGAFVEGLLHELLVPGRIESGVPEVPGAAEETWNSNLIKSMIKLTWNFESTCEDGTNQMQA